MEAAPFDHAAALAACAKGDESAFHRLYEHEAPHMLALCRRLMPSDPEGVLHDTLVLIWHNADQYDSSMGPARPWIYSVLRHVANGRRTRQTTPPPVSPPILPSASAVRGRLSSLASSEDDTAFKAVAHAYLHGADYSQLSTWLKKNETDLRKVVRRNLTDLAL